MTTFQHINHTIINHNYKNILQSDWDISSLDSINNGTDNETVPITQGFQ